MVFRVRLIMLFVIITEVASSRFMTKLVLYTNRQGTWNQARQFCYDSSQTLLETRTQAVLDFLKAAYESSGAWYNQQDVWVGLHIPSADTSKDANSYQWNNGCQAPSADQSFWDSYEPLNTNTDQCARLVKHTMKWGTRQCGNTNYIACQEENAGPCEMTQTTPSTVNSALSKLVEDSTLDSCQAECLDFSMGALECWQVDHFDNKSCLLHLSESALGTSSPIGANGVSYRKVCYKAEAVSASRGLPGTSASENTPQSSCSATPQPADVTSPQEVTELTPFVANISWVTVTATTGSYGSRQGHCSDGLVGANTSPSNINALPHLFPPDSKYDTEAWVEAAQCTRYIFASANTTTSSASCQENHPFVCRELTDVPCDEWQDLEPDRGFISFYYWQEPTLGDCKSKCTMYAYKSKPCLAVSRGSGASDRCYLHFSENYGSVIDLNTLQLSGVRTAVRKCLKGKFESQQASSTSVPPSAPSPSFPSSFTSMFTPSSSSSAPVASTSSSSTSSTSSSDISVSSVSSSSASSPSTSTSSSSTSSASNPSTSSYSTPSSSTYSSYSSSSSASTSFTFSSSTSSFLSSTMSTSTSSTSSSWSFPSASTSSTSSYSTFASSTSSLISPSPSSSSTSSSSSSSVFTSTSSPSFLPFLSTSSVSSSSYAYPDPSSSSWTIQSTGYSSETWTQISPTPGADSQTGGVEATLTLQLSAGTSLETTLGPALLSPSPSEPATSLIEPSAPEITSTESTNYPPQTSASVQSMPGLCQCQWSMGCLGSSNQSVLVHAAREAARQLAANLTVVASDTSMAKRTKISIPDRRTSAQTIGSMGIAIIIVVIALLVASDVVTFVAWLGKLWTSRMRSRSVVAVGD